VVDVHEEDAVKRLVGYIKLAAGSEEPSAKDLKEYLKDKLPEYMIPALYMVLYELPKTNTGKIDRKSLPKPELSELAVKVEYVAPETDTQKLISEVWANLLNLKKVGQNDNFFELGGDSITSTKVVTRLADSGVEITPKDIFENQTLKDLAATIDEHREEHRETA
jgi:acyl carrier protein